VTHRTIECCSHRSKLKIEIRGPYQPVSLRELPALEPDDAANVERAVTTASHTAGSI
jgi:hypothetical protein